MKKSKPKPMKRGSKPSPCCIYCGTETKWDSSTTGNNRRVRCKNPDCGKSFTPGHTRNLGISELLKVFAFICAMMGVNNITIAEMYNITPKQVSRAVSQSRSNGRKNDCIEGLNVEVVNAKYHHRIGNEDCKNGDCYIFQIRKEKIHLTIVTNDNAKGEAWNNSPHGLKKENIIAAFKDPVNVRISDYDVTLDDDW